jgi:hypothetical protein
MILTITADGRLEPHADEGAAGDGLRRATIEIVDHERLLLSAGEQRERCLFRATTHRLSLRCFPAAEGWPTSRWEPDAEHETMVLYRLP